MSRRVGGEGSKDAKIVIVGEAPGAEEEKLGRPFVGMAGQKLLELLTVAGISRSECYITNVVKVRPANNDISPYFEMRKSGVWTSDKYKEYVAELKEELCQVNANVIVPVGNVSLYALTGKLGITKQRGSLLECTLVPGVKVIPTIHPSAALRQYLYTHFIRADLVKVRRESEYKELVYKPRHLVLDPTYTQAMEYIANCHGHKMVAFDIEVVNEEVSCFSLARSDTDAISVPLVRGGADRWSPEEEREIILALAELLEDEGVVKLGQNFIFDCGFMYRKYGIVTRPAECTMIMMGIAYPDFPKGLDFICSMFTDIPYYKDDGKKYYKIGGDERKFWEYNAKDSIVCMDAYPKLYGVLEKQGNVATYRRQSALIEPLMYMQERGLRVDVTGLQEASKKAERQLIELDKQLTEVSGIDLNANSPKQLITYFYVQKGIKPYFKDGKMTTDDDAMRRLARKGIKEAAIIRDMRKIRKLKGTYFDVKLSADGRLRSAMNPVGARTGRLSSSEDIFGEGSNIQNLPGEMKKFIVPDDGYIMYNIDLSQAENRIVAYIAPEPLMIDAFETGIDVHKRTASMIFDKPMEQISDEPGSCELGTGEHSERFWGKKCKLWSCEVLSPDGWVTMASAYRNGIEIAQWSEDGIISFVKPLDWFTEVYSGTIHTIENQRIFQEATPEHKMPLLYLNRNKKYITSSTISKYPNSGHHFALLSGVYRGGTVTLRKHIVQLLVAFQADGSWNSNSIKIALQKERKISRLRQILDGNIDYKLVDGTFSISSKSDEAKLLMMLLGRDKLFGKWLLELSQESLNIFTDELQYWDGNQDGEYYTTILNNAEWVQITCHLCNKAALIHTQDNSKTSAFGDKVVYRVSTRDTVLPATHAIRRSEREVTKVPILCPTVPSGYFMCREHGIVSITGNSNHSLNYAFGYKSFALRFDMSEPQANFIVERYHQAYPGVRQYHSWVQAKLRKDRTLTNCMGRNRLFLDRWGDTLFKEAYAHIPQSTVGDKINEQGLLFIYRNQDQFSDVDLLNQVHDSIVFQVPSTLPWSEHYRILYSVQQSLETLVKWHSTEFKIPADVSMCRTLKDMTKVDMAKGEEAVAEAYVKLFGRDKVELDEVEEEDGYEDVE